MSVIVPTVERGLLAMVFCSIEITGDRPYTKSTSGFATWATNLVASPAEGYAACCEAIGAMDLRPDRSRISAPTLVIAGAQDPSIPTPHSEAIAAAIPGARLEVLDPGAHIVAVERADETAALVLDHLQA